MLLFVLGGFAVNVANRMTAESGQIVPNQILDIPCRCGGTDVVANEDAEREDLTIYRDGVACKCRNAA